MERKIQEGDYVPDGQGGLTVLSGREEALARVLFRLTARRGSLPFLPRLGSRLYRLGREKPALRQSLAAQDVAEALGEEPELTVQSVELEERDGTGLLTVWLERQGEALTAQMEVYSQDGWSPA